MQLARASPALTLSFGPGGCSGAPGAATVRVGLSPVSKPEELSRMLLPVSTFLAPSGREHGQPAVPATHGRLFVPFAPPHVVRDPQGGGPAGHRPGPAGPPPQLLLGHADAAQFLSWGEEHFSAMDGILKRSGYAPARGRASWNLAAAVAG